MQSHTIFSPEPTIEDWFSSLEPVKLPTWYTEHDYLYTLQSMDKQMSQHLTCSPDRPDHQEQKSAGP